MSTFLPKPLQATWRPVLVVAVVLSLLISALAPLALAETSSDPARAALEQDLADAEAIVCDSEIPNPDPGPETIPDPQWPATVDQIEVEWVSNGGNTQWYPAGHTPSGNWSLTGNTGTVTVPNPEPQGQVANPDFGPEFIENSDFEQCVSDRGEAIATAFAALDAVLAVTDPITEVWDGRGTDSENCGLAGDGPRDADDGWIHWVYGTKGNSTEASLTLGGTGSGTYAPGVPLNANTWHFFTPFSDFDGLTAEIMLDAPGGPGGGLVISDYCPGDDPVDDEGTDVEVGLEKLWFDDDGDLVDAPDDVADVVTLTADDELTHEGGSVVVAVQPGDSVDYTVSEDSSDDWEVIACPVDVAGDRQGVGDFHTDTDVTHYVCNELTADIDVDPDVDDPDVDDPDVDDPDVDDPDVDDPDTDLVVDPVIDDPDTDDPDTDLVVDPVIDDPDTDDPDGDEPARHTLDRDASSPTRDGTGSGTPTPTRIDAGAGATASTPARLAALAWGLAAVAGLAGTLTWHRRTA